MQRDFVRSEEDLLLMKPVQVYKDSFPGKSIEGTKMIPMARYVFCLFNLQQTCLSSQCSIRSFNGLTSCSLILSQEDSQTICVSCDILSVKFYVVCVFICAFSVKILNQLCFFPCPAKRLLFPVLYLSVPVAF